MHLATVDLLGAPTQVMSGHDTPGARLSPDVAGVDVRPTLIEGAEHTVVQVLLDDDRPDFDPGLYEAPIVVELLDRSSEVVARELLDHDAFRRALHAERQQGESVRRGVLVLTGGELPARWVRLAFLPIPVASTAGTTLQLRRTSVAELVEGVERAAMAGSMTDGERNAASTAIEHLHPSDS